MWPVGTEMYNKCKIHTRFKRLSKKKVRCLIDSLKEKSVSTPEMNTMNINYIPTTLKLKSTHTNIGDMLK